MLFEVPVAVNVKAPVPVIEPSAVPVPPLATGKMPVTSFANLTVKVLLVPVMVLLVRV